MYNQEISRAKPMFFCFLIDQSGSMAQQTPTGQTAADAVGEIINKFIADTVMECSKDEGVRDYFYISVIGYGNEQGVSYAFGGNLENKDIIPISEIEENPLRIENKKFDGIEQKFPVRFDAKAYGQTPMREAFSLAKEAVERFISKFSDSYPPTILNITDGMSTDGDPTDIVEDIKNLSTSDGNVLVYNAHLDVLAPGNSIKFPKSLNNGDANAQMLFNMSSELPEASISIANSRSSNIESGSKGYIYNGGLDDLIKFIDIGTRKGDALPNNVE